jgi:hypothetical protein
MHCYLFSLAKPFHCTSQYPGRLTLINEFWVLLTSLQTVRIFYKRSSKSKQIFSLYFELSKFKFNYKKITILRNYTNVLADEHHQRTVRALHVGQRVDLAIGAFEGEISGFPAKVTNRGLDSHGSRFPRMMGMPGVVAFFPLWGNGNPEIPWLFRVADGGG